MSDAEAEELAREMEKNTENNRGQFVRSHEIDLHRSPLAGEACTHHGAKSHPSPPE